MASASANFQPPPWCRAPQPGAPRHRLRFLADASAGAAAVRLGDELELAEKAVYTIGRAETGTDVRLRGELASRLHAAVCQDAEGRKFLVDLRSTHGTFLDGKRLQPHVPTRWNAEVRVTFGSGSKAEVAELAGEQDAASNGRSAGSKASDGRASIDLEEAPEPKRAKASSADDLMASLYGDLPEATVNQVAPRVEPKRVEPVIEAPAVVTRVVFLDIDGVLRSVHGRTDFAANVRTMVVGGQRVALMGDSSSTNDNLAGIDFWPQALRALRHIVQKTKCAIVLSSDWRKQDALIEGVNNQLAEHGMPKLIGCTPDLDRKDVQGVVKALHSNVREKRAKEIRRWVKQNPGKTETWVAIDDMDLSPSRKDELLHQANGGSEPMPFLDPATNFVRCNPAVGLTMELAKIAVALLNGHEATEQEIQAAYGGAPEPVSDPAFQGMGPTTFVG